jgi:hypothetical protein
MMQNRRKLHLEELGERIVPSSSPINPALQLETTAIIEPRPTDPIDIPGAPSEGSEFKLNDGIAFKGMIDAPGALSTDSTQSVLLSTALGNHISLITNPLISSSEIYQLEIRVGDGQFTFSTLEGVQLTPITPVTPITARNTLDTVDTSVPSAVRLIGTASALNAALANSVYSASNNPNGVAQDTIQLNLSGLGEKVVAETGATLGTENHTWQASISVKREKPVGPAPTPGQTQVVQGPGDFAIPRGSIIAITDNTARGDSWSLWWAKPSGVTQESGIKSWDDLITYLEANKPPGGYSALVISGHGSGDGGVQASGGALNGANLTAAQAAKIKALLKDGAPVILLACCQGNHAETQTMADKLGHPVIANKGDVNHGNTGAGDWVRFNPK